MSVLRHTLVRFDVNQPSHGQYVKFKEHQESTFSFLSYVYGFANLLVKELAELALPETTNESVLAATKRGEAELYKEGADFWAHLHGNTPW